jgi:hypothetical protein
VGDRVEGKEAKDSMEPKKPLEISAKENVGVAEYKETDVIVIEAGPIDGPKERITVAAATSSGDIVAGATGRYGGTLQPEVKEFMIETVERSKKHFVEGLKFSFSPTDWSFSFELKREPKKVTTTKLTGKKESKG